LTEREPDAITVEMVVKVLGRERHSVPLERALSIFQAALAESGGDVARAKAAIDKEFAPLRQRI
jgi:hypothetical protein